MNSKWGFTIAMCALAGLAVTAEATVYWEDFNDPNAGVNGWTGDNAYYSPTGGIGDSGCKAGWRNTYAPYHTPRNPPASDSLLGNLEVRFGDTITFDYWLKDLAGTYAAEPQFYVFAPKVDPSFPGSSNIWGLPIGPLDLSNWVNVEFTINTNWTDEEARAAGWYNTAWNGGNFATVWENVTDYNFLTGRGSGRVETAIDNVSVTPEPASLVLLVLGAGLLRRRR